MTSACRLSLVLAALAAVAGVADAAAEPPTLLVAGLHNESDEVSDPRSPWRDRRLGMGIRGRLVEMYDASGGFAVVEERALAPSLGELLDGWWLAERTAAATGDLLTLHRETGADWIAHGELTDVGVTRDRVRGVVGGRRWAYRAAVRLCLHARDGRELCDTGEGESVTRVMGAVVEYRGDEVAFDQAGPAEAVARALADAFDRLMPRWAATEAAR